MSEILSEMFMRKKLNKYDVDRAITMLKQVRERLEEMCVLHIEELGEEVEMDFRRALCEVSDLHTLVRDKHWRYNGLEDMYEEYLFMKELKERADLK